jgi:hypothetical protein
MNRFYSILRRVYATGSLFLRCNRTICLLPPSPYKHKRLKNKIKTHNALVEGVGRDLVHERGGGAPVLVGQRFRHALLHLRAGHNLVLAVVGGVRVGSGGSMGGRPLICCVERPSWTKGAEPRGIHMASTYASSTMLLMLSRLMFRFMVGAVWRRRRKGLRGYAGVGVCWICVCGCVIVCVCVWSDRSDGPPASRALR